MPRRANVVENEEFEGIEDLETPDFFGDMEDGPELPPDPKPKRRSSRAVPSSGAGRVTVAMRKQVDKEVVGMARMLSELWEMRDQHCGRVAVERHEKIAAAFSDWICDHPQWVNSIVDAGQSVKVFRIIQECWPLLVVVYAHHIGKSLQDSPEEEWGMVPSDFTAPRF